MTKQPRHEVTCPHPECQGKMFIPDDLPAGEYDCICKSLKVRVVWASYLSGERKPYLGIAKEQS